MRSHILNANICLHCVVSDARNSMEGMQYAF